MERKARMSINKHQSEQIFKMKLYIYLIETSAGIDCVKEELDDFEVKKEKQDPLSLEPAEYTGYYFK